MVHHSPSTALSVRRHHHQSHPEPGPGGEETVIADLRQQLRAKDTELRRLAVRTSVDTDHTRLLQRLREEVHRRERAEQDLCVVRRDKEALDYEVSLLRNVVDLEAASDDHVTAADALARAKALETRLAQVTAEFGAQQRAQAAGAEDVRRRDESAAESARVAQQLRERVKELEAELATMRRGERELRAAAGLAAEARSEATAAAAEMEDANMELQDRYDAEVRRGAELSEALEAARADAAAARQTWTEGQRQLEALTAALDDAQAYMESCDEQMSVIEDLEKELRDARRRLEHTTEVLEVQRSSFESLEKREADAKARAATAEAALAKAEAGRTEAEHLHRAAAEKLQHAADHGAADRGRCATLEARVQRQSEELQELELSNAALAARCERLGHTLAEREQEASRVRATLRQVQERAALESVCGPALFASASPSLRGGSHTPGQTSVGSMSLSAARDSADHRSPSVEASAKLRRLLGVHDAGDDDQDRLHLGSAGQGHGYVSSNASSVSRSISTAASPECRLALTDIYALSPVTPTPVHPHRRI